ncbi:MAG TPA: hypothetical protein PKJ13_05785 [bacterium]|nr:hypothetical protein [bacterium]
MLGLLLHSRLRALIYAVRRGGKKGRRRILGYIGLIILPVLVLINIYAMMEAMMAAPELGLPAILLLQRNILLAIFIMLLFSGLALVLHIFFLSRDLPLLMSAPVPLATIFQFKFIETTSANSTLFFGIALPVLISAGIAVKAPLLFWILLLPLSLLFLAIPTGLATLLAMGLVSVMPARRAKSISALFLSLISIAIWLGFQMLRPERIRPGAAGLPGQNYLELGGRLATWFPSDWLVNALMHTTTGRTAAAGLNILLLLGAGALLYSGAAALLGRALHRDTFSGIESGSRSRRVTRQTVRIAPAGKSGLFATLVRRDFKLIFRDTQQLIQILLFTTMMVLLPFLNRTNMAAESGELAHYYPYFFLFIFSTLISSTISTRMIPMERTAFGLFKLAPVRLRTVWLAKVTVSFLFTLTSALFAAAVVAFFHHTSAGVLLRVLLLLVILNIGATSCGGLFGARYANFSWDHPKRMLNAGSGFFLSLILMVFVGIVGGIVALSLFILSTPDPGIAASAALTLFLLAFGTASAEKKLDKIEWTY